MKTESRFFRKNDEIFLALLKIFFLFQWYASFPSIEICKKKRSWNGLQISHWICQCKGFKKKINMLLILWTLDAKDKNVSTWNSRTSQVPVIKIYSHFECVFSLEGHNFTNRLSTCFGIWYRIILQCIYFFKFF